MLFLLLRFRVLQSRVGLVVESDLSQSRDIAGEGGNVLLRSVEETSGVGR